MFVPFLSREIRAADFLPGYFFYGEETFFADQFIAATREIVAAPDSSQTLVERFELEETSWTEIIDTARTAAFLFSPWRLIIVKASEVKSGGEKFRGGFDEGRRNRYLSAADEKAIREYFASPTARTVLIVVLPGKVKKSHPLVKLFSSLPETAVCVRELKPLREKQILEWAVRSAAGHGRTMTDEAAQRLYEIVGSDLRLLENEVAKLTDFTEGRKAIDVEDVDQVTAWLRSYESYDLDERLERGDVAECLVVLNSLLKSGERPEQILGRLAGFFRNILLAMTWLEEGRKDKKSIFRAFFPYIQENFGELYKRKFDLFFGAVAGISREDLGAILEALRAADLRIKSTDIPPQTVLETFFFEYGRIRKAAGTIWPGRPRFSPPGGRAGT